MKNCNQITALLSVAQERPLTRAERWSIQWHLMMCSGCRRFSNQLPFLRQAIQYRLQQPEKDGS